MDQLVQILGSLLILIAFAAAQRGALSTKSRAYVLLNLVGSTILAVLAARRGKPYIYGLAFTFGAYVLYDLARLLHWNVQAGILSWLFLLATISALIAVWGLYRKW